MSETNTATPAAPKKDPQPPDPRELQNYGDVALNLPPDWSRSRNIGDPGFVLSTVGHENGVADAYKTRAPGELHQFRWCSPDDQNAMSILRTKHFELCTKADWTKNPHLWMFDGEGYIVHNGQRLMARAKEFYDADRRAEEEEQARQRGKVRSEDASVESRIKGDIMEDDRGRQLRPLSPQRRRS